MKDAPKIKFLRRQVVFGGLSLAAFPLKSAANNASLEEVGRLARIVDGDSFVFQSGLKVRLANIFAPQRKTPFYEEAKTALLALLNSRSIGLYYYGPKRDRYGRALAQVFTLRPDGTPDQWIQAEMIRLGFGRVRSYADSVWRIGDLLAYEIQARNAGRGLWQSSDYAIRSPAPNELAQDVDSFQIVEGLVISSAQFRGQTYLNFGSDYKTDFTVSIARKNRKAFEKAGINLTDLEGARLRVRGWVELYNGPVIWLDHPQTLEFADQALS